MALPTTTNQYNVTGKGGFQDLKPTEAAPIPKLGDHDVLVNWHYASLNYRDLIIPMGKYPFPVTPNVIPLSDAAGTVIAVGPRCTLFHAGSKVCSQFNQSHQHGAITRADTMTGLGGSADGVLRTYGVYEEKGLVRMPENLTFREAATLSCAGVTAWNGLMGIKGREVGAGDWVITQGTGGVSLFALQFAKALRANVIATTSSDEKGKVLKQLGADHVINYRNDPNWGETAKKIITEKSQGLVEGASHIIEVGGPNTMAQSLKAIRPEGVISVIGFLGGMKGEAQPSMLDCLTNICTVRGVLVGSKEQFEDMGRLIEAVGLRPVVDEGGKDGRGKGWGMDDVREAMQYMWEQKHLGKVVIRIDDKGGSKL